MEKSESQQVKQTEETEETEEQKETETAGEQPQTKEEPEKKTAPAKEPEEKADAAEQPEKKASTQQPAEEELKKKLEEANQQLEKQKNLLLRTTAEYDNFRKRTVREKASIYDDATAKALQEILNVADSLERALAQRECSADDMRKGVELVYKQMQSAFAKLGVEEMGKEGDEFDPQLHNAISHVEDESSGENVVVKVFQKGYKIGDRVIRHAMVQVAN